MFHCMIGRFGNWGHMQYKVAYIHLTFSWVSRCSRAPVGFSRAFAKMLLILWVVFGEQTLSRSSVTERLFQFRDSHDCKTTHGRRGLQEHKMRTMWCVLKRLFTEPKTVEAFVKKVVIVIDGWHNKLSKDVLCLPVHTKNSVRNTVTTG
jgi:hypothetical protein